LFFLAPFDRSGPCRDASEEHEDPLQRVRVPVASRLGYAAQSTDLDLDLLSGGAALGFGSISAIEIVIFVLVIGEEIG
jgi:hypothetical protein